MTDYDDARRRFDEAVAARDRLAAELALSDMKQYVTDLQSERDVATLGDEISAERDAVLWAEAQFIEWEWVDEGDEDV